MSWYVVVIMIVPNIAKAERSILYSPLSGKFSEKKNADKEPLREKWIQRCCEYYLIVCMLDGYVIVTKLKNVDSYYAI